MSNADTPHFPCVLEAWRAHEVELRHWLRSRVSDAAQADDILQDVFVKALTQGGHFCRLDSPRAWLYQVGRHAVIDLHRLSKTTVPAGKSLAQPEVVGRPVDALTTGLAESLGALDPDDRDVIVRCDIEGETQPAYAAAHHLTLPAVKSRVQRARARRRQHLVERASVRFGPSGQVCCHAIEVEEVENLREIAAYGIMSTPGVVIEGAVVHAGGVPSRQNVAGWLTRPVEPWTGRTAGHPTPYTSAPVRH